MSKHAHKAWSARNQATAAARAGAAVVFIAALGTDAAAATLREALGACGVDLRAVRTSNHPTGTAYVVVDRDGENMIVVDPGANADLRALLPDELAELARCRVLLCQLEVPLDTVLAATQHAQAHGALTIVNAAPACDLPPEADRSIDVLIVNEPEARQLSGAVNASAADVAHRLLERFPEVVVTLGAAGAMHGERRVGVTPVPGHHARAVVDTTGAGDAFCGMYAAARAAGEEPGTAVSLACVAGAISVESSGAGLSAPELAAVRERLAAAGDRQ